ncbi:DUF4439 domain-containing protein [Cumulibacter manganitolerans]|uniref:DUF4439 domain-containing protein n=1 Tax=Cumulibacter manganitolerans TaxID=1884992 RepID=UPI001297402C|nr:DUF4439 domain-containing protein [Cumulibacter manganitolerans]
MTDDAASLQAALAAQHATIWAYGEIGAAVGEAHRAAVEDADATNRTRRQALEDILRSLGQDPAPSEPGYTLPAPVTDDASALALAARLEDAMAQQWRHCCGRVGSTAVRTFCVDALAATTVAALRWRQAAGGVALPPAFPGMP